MSVTKKYLLPADDVNDESAIINELYFHNGDRVKIGEIIYSFETTKSVVDVSCDDDGFINYLVEKGEDITVGALVCEIAKNASDFQPKQNNKTEDGMQIMPTKKAVWLAEKHDLNLQELGLKGIVRESDIAPFIKKGQGVESGKRCTQINKANKFIHELLVDKSFRHLSSDEKIMKYQEAGYDIADGVNIGVDSVIIGNKIEIADGVHIGTNTYIEAPVVSIGPGSRIGNDCEIVGSLIQIGPMNTISNRVNVDISGGRHTDSNLITGRGCLIATEAYINICREVILGENVALSPRSMIYTHSYWQSVLDGYPSTFGPVQFEDDTWLGSVAQVMPNVVVGKGSIIMSNSLASTSVKPDLLVGGVPAKIVKDGIRKKRSTSKLNRTLIKLFEELSGWLHMNHCDVEKLGSKFYSIIHEGKKQKCLLLIYEDIDELQSESIDIVLTYAKPDKLPFEYQTMFMIKEKTVIGPVGEIEHQILEFFRRKGIRFYA